MHLLTFGAGCTSTFGRELSFTDIRAKCTLSHAQTSKKITQTQARCKITHIQINIRLNVSNFASRLSLGYFLSCLSVGKCTSCPNVGKFVSRLNVRTCISRLSVSRFPFRLKVGCLYPARIWVNLQPACRYVYIPRGLQLSWVWLISVLTVGKFTCRVMPDNLMSAWTSVSVHPTWLNLHPSWVWVIYILIEYPAWMRINWCPP